MTLKCAKNVYLKLQAIKWVAPFNSATLYSTVPQTHNV